MTDPIERLRSLLERVRLYAVVDPLDGARLLGLELDIDDALAGRPEREARRRQKEFDDALAGGPEREARRRQKECDR